VPIRNPRALAAAILDVLDRRAPHRAMAQRGGQLVSQMFSPRRTAAEIKRIYQHVLGLRSEPPEEFDSTTVLAQTYAARH